MYSRGPFFGEFASDGVCTDIRSREIGLLGEVGRLDGEEHFLLVKTSSPSRFSQFFNIGIVAYLEKTYAFWESLTKLLAILLSADNNDVVELTLVFVELSVDSIERVGIGLDFNSVGIAFVEEYHVCKTA